MVARDRANFELALKLRREGAPIGEIFAFISGLYFRGKLAYAEAFAAPPPGMPASLVITSGRGLLPPETPVDIEQLREIATVPIDSADARYRLPLERDARRLAEAISNACDVVLLGSVASTKYLEPLIEVFGERLLFPIEFVGRGDMSRGGLMLRSAREGKELTYVPALGAVRHGPRPPKLPRIKWRNPSAPETPGDPE
jgi:hypothetical protein